LAVFDIGILVLAGLSIFRGVRQGFIIGLSSFVSVIMGILVALKLTFPIVYKFFGESTGANILSLIVFLALFILTIWASMWLAKRIKAMIDYTPLKVVDNLAGALFSVVKMFLLVSVLLWGLHSLEVDLPESWLEESFSYNFVVSLGPWVYLQIATLMPFFQDILDNMKAPITQL